MSKSHSMLAAAVVACGLACPLPAEAQDRLPNFNKLNDALERRLPSPQASRSRSLGNAEDAPAPSPTTRRREDFHWVKPKSKGAPPHDGDRSDAAPVAPPTRTATVRFLAAGALGSGKAGSETTQLAQAAPAGEAPAAAPPAAVPVVRKNSYVILIKPEILRKADGGADDVIRLLNKYGLEAVPSARSRSVVAPSGRMVVQQGEDALESAPQRGLEAPGAKSDNDVRSQLEPEIIRKLRKEGIVDDAYVNSTIRNNNTLPRPLSTRTKADGKVFGWIWNDPSSPRPDATRPSDTSVTPPADGTATKPAEGTAASVNGSAQSLLQPVPEVIDDGNWGLKAIRVPAMWTVIKRFRAAQADAAHRPKVAVIDQGFNAHKGLAYDIVDPPKVSASKGEPCEIAHGTHVAGIIGAATKSDVGIDGIVPEANIEAVPFQLDFALEDPGAEEQEWMRRWVLFADVMNDTEDYIVREQASANPLRVINMSLAYNLGGLIAKDPGTVPELVRHLQAQAKDVQRTVRRYEDQVLFVVAAGNDSEERAAPLDTKWASPLAWAGTQAWATAPPSPNILVVEAFDRTGQRPRFSNIGGHVSAPGVNIMSTLGPGENVFGVCSGTSQAAPHVAAIATLMFELAPNRKPKEIAEILRTTAVAAGDPAVSPRIDALEAVMRVYPEATRLLADLNRDGVVDEADLAIFQKQLDAIYDNSLNGTAFTEDLNEDGAVDNNECLWPTADLNGSGHASLDGRDARNVLGARRSDLEVMQMAWTKGPEDFQNTIASSPLAAVMARPLETGALPVVTEAPVAATACR